MSPSPSPTTSLAILAEFHSSSIQLLSRHLDQHVPTVRHGVLALRTSRPLSKRLVKQLTNLDLAYKVSRHATEQYTRSVLNALASELKDPETGTRDIFTTPKAVNDLDLFRFQQQIDTLTDQLDHLMASLSPRVGPASAAVSVEIHSDVGDFDIENVFNADFVSPEKEDDNKKEKDDDKDKKNDAKKDDEKNDDKDIISLLACIKDIKDGHEATKKALDDLSIRLKVGLAEPIPSIPPIEPAQNKKKKLKRVKVSLG